MAGYRTLFYPTGIFNFLSTRSYLITSSQHLSSKMKRHIEKSILPPAPKKPMSAFFKYVQQEMKALKEQYPELKQTEITSKLSKKWKVEDPEYKRQLQKEFEEEFQDYTKKLIEYRNSITDEQRQKLEEEKRRIRMSIEKLEYKQTLEILGKPRKPMSGFFIFLNEKRSNKDESIKPKDWIKQVSNEWKNLPSEEKQKFMTKAAELMEQYHKEVKEWEQKMVDAGQMSSIKCRAVPLLGNAVNKHKA